MLGIVFIGGSPLIGLIAFLLVAIVFTLSTENMASLGLFYAWIAFWGGVLIYVHSSLL